MSRKIIIDFSDTSSGSQLTWFTPDVAKAIKVGHTVQKPEAANQNIESSLKRINKTKKGIALSRVLEEARRILLSYRTKK